MEVVVAQVVEAEVVEGVDLMAAQTAISNNIQMNKYQNITFKLYSNKCKIHIFLF